MSEIKQTVVVSPERPAARDETRAVAALVGVVAAAAALRFWSLSGGLPTSLGVDEPQIMVRALAMVKTGDFHPHFFDYPGLYLYVQAMVVVARFLAGASSGLWSSLSQVSDYDFYLWGRAVTAAFGTATVFLLYRAGSRWGVRQGLIAAVALAVLPVHVRESHFVLTDVPATFFTVLAFLLALGAEERRRAAAFAWAGAAAGLAAGTKYTAWVSILLPLVAAGYAGGSLSTRLRFAVAAVAGFGGAYLLAAPYTVLDLPGFLNGFGALAAAVPRRAVGAEAGWIVYLKHLRNAMGWPALLLAAFGLALFAWQAFAGRSRARHAMVLLFVAVFWSMIVGRTLIYARYLMPMVPFACLLLAVALVALVDRLRVFVPTPSVAAGVVVLSTAAALVQPTIASVGFDRQMGRQATETIAIDWIRQNVKPGARIVHEGAMLHFPADQYQLEYLRSLTEKNVEYYLGGNADYVVATSAAYERAFRDPNRFQNEYLAYRNLFNRLQPVFTVHPSDDHPGAEIRIFSVPR